MAIYRTIHMSFWTDPKVDDDFSPEDKYFYLYLLTNPHTNLCGCYEISTKQMVRETGYNEDTVMRLLQRMEYTHNVIQYDSETKEVFIPRWGKYNWFNSDDVRTGVIRSVSTVKSERFKKEFASMGLIDPPQTVYTWSDDGGGISVPVTVTDTVNKNKGKYPSIEEVRAYVKEKGLKVNADDFFTYFTTPNDKGETWVDSKGNKVKNWKQKLLTWENMDRNRSKSRNTLNNYKETGVSHPETSAIAFSEDDL